MSHRSDYPKSDPYRPADAAGRHQGDSSGGEDPLVELARIVNRNRQAQTADRVQTTDYFAGLEESELLETASAGRGELVGGSEAQRLEPNWPELPSLDELAATAPKALERTPDLFGGWQAPSEAPEQVYEQVGQPVRAPSLDDSLSADLEQSLTAELEDELLGALQASFEPQRTQPDVAQGEAGYDQLAQSVWPAHGEAYGEPGHDQVGHAKSDYVETGYVEADFAELDHVEAGYDAGDHDEGVSGVPRRADAEQNKAAWSPQAHDEIRRWAPRGGVAAAADAPGQTVPDEPAYEEPAYEEPAYEEPAYREAAYEEATYEEPAYEEAAYEDTAYEEPLHAAPAYREPSYREPAAREAVFDDWDLDAPVAPRQPHEAPDIAQQPVATRHPTEPTRGAAADAFADLDDIVGSLFEDEQIPARPAVQQAFKHGATSIEPTVARVTPEPERAPAAPLRGRIEPDIDDMAWPAAAGALPEDAFADEIGEDEDLPPPEGYDLDAVARAMHESDPTLAGAGVLPPHSAIEQSAAPHGTGSRKGLYAAAAVLGLAVVGGATFALMDFSSVDVPSGPPPVISGIEEPLKVFPDETPVEGADRPSKLIYDRVGGTPQPQEERLVLQDTPAPAALPPAPAPAATDEVPVAGPKRVRTLVVRPDGTIISGGEDEGPAENGVRTIDTARVQPQTVPAPVQEAPVAQPDVAAPAPTVAAPPESLTPAPAAPGPALAPAVPALVADGAPAETADVPSVLPRRKPDEGPTRVAAAPAAPAPAVPVGNAPLNLTQPQAAAPAAPAPVAPAPAASGPSVAPGTYMVQITSQRSEDQARAAYEGLQRRFPSILGGQTPVIQAAVLDDRGTFYRVRIPAGSKEAADALCESLKAAGGDCFVRRN
ncbi:SPOR domain-containing protein [Polymorphum gilvum]|uniref:Proline-rich region n=1 Tax=Polymorphum gilvum (strain LMG 25793 / CGMCC 1.9160 / SL003B-26A1) TaxID=991905 RepID=F2J0T4_POLGS|nr:SPOR domain-containing protein [Polymorphum gilvum]ADZ70770.1 Proline-rich region [Polymorphum gilvum SL003B-26A1]